MSMKKKIIFFLFSINSRIIKEFILWALSRNDGQYYSLLLRDIYKEFKGIDIGLYTHGGCFKINSFSRNTIIGRYCSIATTVLAFNRNHPLNFKSTHAFFFNSNLGYCKGNNNPYVPLQIGHDVWIGSYAVILPTVQNIGTGAVIAAGSIVNKDIPPYAVVTGNPARIIRYRFSQNKIKELLESKWWEMSIDEIRNKHTDEFFQPYEDLTMGNDSKM